MHTIHELKTYPVSYQAMVEDKKKADFRKDDRSFEVGDTLLLREWSPSDKKYTGREIEAEITHILRGPDFGIPKGYVMMSLVYIRKMQY